MNILTPSEFADLFLIGNTIHVGYEILFGFYDKKEKDVLEYVATLYSVTDDLNLYVDNILGGNFYVKNVERYMAQIDIKTGLIEFSRKRKREPMFIVDCDKYFKDILRLQRKIVGGQR